MSAGTPSGSPELKSLRAIAPSVGDLFTGLGALLVSVAGVTVERADPGWNQMDPIGASLLLLACVGVSLWRTAPTAAAVIALVASLVGIALDYPLAASALISLALVGNAASRTETSMSGALGVFSGIAVAISWASGPETVLPVALIGGFVLGAMPALIGRRLRAERIKANEATELALRLEERRNRDVERAVAEERLRIARDVHDITGHHLSAISLQSAGGSSITEDLAARSTFEQIHKLSHAALSQTRAVLGILREDSGEVALSPSPRLDRITELLEPLRSAGIADELEFTGDRRELSETVEMCGYRVIQESITNVARHSRATTARISLDYGEDILLITVEDDGPQADTDPVIGGGIEGMKERVTLVGGEFTAGPTGDRRAWRVRASLPIGEDL